MKRARDFAFALIAVALGFRFVGGGGSRRG